jgi:hypothetical protein
MFHVREGRVTRLVAYLNCERVLPNFVLAPEAGSSRS